MTRYTRAGLCLLLTLLASSELSSQQQTPSSSTTTDSRIWGQKPDGTYVPVPADTVGKLIVLPYARPDDLVMGTTAAITDTTSTAVIVAPGGLFRNYLTQCTATNAHATVGTFVKILDGSTIIYEAFAAPAGGGFVATFPAPLRGTAATAINAQAVTTGTNFIVSCSGFKGL